MRENTASGYRAAVHTHLIPGVGAYLLEKLTAEHIEKLTRKV